MHDSLSVIALQLIELSNGLDNELIKDSLHSLILQNKDLNVLEKGIANLLFSASFHHVVNKLDIVKDVISKEIRPKRYKQVTGLNYINSELNKVSSKILNDKLNSFDFLQKSLLIAVFVVVVIGGTIAVLNTKSITGSIRRLTRIVLRMGKGAIPEIHYTQANDAIGLAVSALKDGLELKTNFSEAIGEGNLFMPFKPIGKDDKLGKALVKMRNKLVSLADEEKLNKWKSEGISQFVDLLQRHTTIESVSKEVLTKMVEYFEINQAVMYVKEVEDNSINYQLIAAYGQNDLGEDWKIIQSGVGLLGESIKSKKTIHLQNVHSNKRKLNSKFVDIEICNIIIVPFVFRKKVFGVIKMGSSTKFSEDAIWLLEQLAEKLGNAYNNLTSQAKTDKLLKEIEKTNLDLVSSEEELKQSVEEIRLVNEKLASSHSKLEKSLLELRTAKKESELANNSKTQFLANMSHEIRSPLNTIVGFSQILLNQTVKLGLPFYFKDNLDNIIIAGENLSELINNILDLSKIESGKLEPTLESINFKQLFQGIYHINKANATKKDLCYTFDLEHGLPEFIQTDRTKLNQILMNLLSNAIKFTPKGKSIRLEALRDDGFIMIKVTDQGIGVAADRLKSIFESFEQADNTITRRFGGTGLGLSITKQMVEILKGKIWVESEEGKGSVFFVKIPLVVAKSDEHYKREILLTNCKFSTDNIVLAVEDMEMNQQMLKVLFDELHLDIHFANNGEEGIEKIKDLKPDLVLMDIHMPVMDGIEATRRIRQIPEFKYLPIIALSADAFIEQQNKAFKAGLSKYITKPIDFNKTYSYFK